MGERVPLGILVPLRILCGLILILEGWGKLQSGWLHGSALLGMLDRWVADGDTYHFFLPIVETARAHPKIFGALVTAGELVIGTSMLLGLLTRLGAFLGAALLFSIAFGSGQRLAPPGSALLMGAIFVIFLFAPPGRVLGLDAALRARLPRWMV
ncbi:MAG TPA: DoxX family membrane protein [Steroidobacteraceae bacterium]